MSFIPENIIELDSLPLIGGIIWIVLIFLIPILLVIGIQQNKAKKKIKRGGDLNNSGGTKAKGFEN